MPTYIAFLRGVSPQNAKMSELKSCFEKAGFTEVKTVLATGNVRFHSASSSIDSIERKIEAATLKHLGRKFNTIVRSVDSLEKMLHGDDPYAGCSIPDHAKRVVSFLRKPPLGELSFPIERDGARIVAMRGAEVFTAYVPHPKGPVFMLLIQKTFGDEVTTRTWDTVKKCVAK